MEFELEQKRQETRQIRKAIEKTLNKANEVLQRREECILHLVKLNQKLAEVNRLIAQHAANSDKETTTMSKTSKEVCTNDKDIRISGPPEDRNCRSVSLAIPFFT